MYSLEDLPEDLADAYRAKIERQASFREKIDQAKQDILGTPPDNALKIPHGMLVARFESDIAVLVPELEMLKAAKISGEPFTISDDVKSIIRRHLDFNEPAQDIVIEYSEAKAEAEGVSDAKGFYARIVQRFDETFNELFKAAAKAPSPASDTDHHPLGEPVRAEPVDGHSSHPARRAGTQGPGRDCALRRN